MKPIAAITVDLDVLEHYRAIHGLPPKQTPGPDPTYEVGVRRLLELFESFGIESTLFVVGRDVEEPVQRGLLEQAHARGHELGNHTFEHRYDLREHPPHVRAADIAGGERAVESVTGRRPVGFRAPGYNLDDAMLQTLAQRGYLYDSSVFACPPYYLAKGAVMASLLLRGKPSHSAMTKPQNMLAPTRPYRPKAGQFWRSDARSTLPLEIPMCVVPGVRFPVIGTSLHLMGRAGFSAAYPLLKRYHASCLQLEFHSIDFMDATDLDEPDLVARQPDLKVPWERKKSLYSFIFEKIARDYTFAPLEAFARGWGGA